MVTNDFAMMVPITTPALIRLTTLLIPVTTASLQSRRSQRIKASLHTSAGRVLGPVLNRSESSREILAATALDTTVAQVVNVTATWSVANAANQVRLDVLRVEIW